MSSIKKMSALIEDNMEFKIGDQVWHKSSVDSGLGLITNTVISLSDGNHDHYVSFGPGVIIQCSPIELTTEKPIEI